MTSITLDRELVRRYGFAQFCKLAWSQVEACEMIWEPHMDLVCAHYEAVMRGEIRDLVVAVPPGMSKSVLTSIMLNAWVWTHKPWYKFLTTSYAEDLSLSFARRTLELITSQWYQERWPDVIVKGGGRASSGDFWITGGGRRFSTMIAGVATGVHSHALICDDPHKPNELKGGGEAARRHLDDDWMAWTQTFSSRHADPKTFARIVIAQRLHEEDISGRMVRSPKTVHLCLPQMFESKRAYRSKWGDDHRSVEGELLAPKRFPQEVIEEKRDPKTGMSPRDFAAQQQQRPAPESGNLFLREWFQNRWTSLPPYLSNYTISVDATFKANATNDFVVIQLWATLGDKLYLLEQIRRRLTFTETCSQILSLVEAWPQVSQVVVEDKANGSAIIDTLRSQISGLVAVDPRGGKFSRASATTGIWRAQRVFLPANASWLSDFIEEHASFPASSYDDQVDCGTQALSFLDSLNHGGDFLKSMRQVKL